MAKIDISIIIPVYNEAENIEELYDEIRQVFLLTDRSYEIIFVNDFSTDNSLRILNQLASKDKRVTVIDFERNFGQTAALSAGIVESRGEIIIPMDGDRQNDPADIPKLVEKIEEGYSVVSGWRKNRRDAFIRVLLSKIANWIIRWSSGVEIHDNGCSLKAYRRDVIAGVQLYGEMHRFISVYALWSGGRVTEVVVNHRSRVAGKSKYGFSRIFKVILDLQVLKFLHKYMSRPMHFFGKYGFYAIALSIGFAIWSLLLKIISDISISRTPLPTISMMFLIVGIQLILTGILAELMMRTYYESQNKKPYVIKKIIKKK
ncbi:MAG: glycosyltransferase family 2 protein [Candidatus Berkelbacteria bacterium]|nr:glycosyltransferase family 2 protein [Candidatus Berkelbacteria bacterium]